MGKILRREGVDPKVVEMFYRAVTQVVLLFGLDNWVLLVTMEITVEGAHSKFLRKITGRRVWQKVDWTLSTPSAE